jgi:hypothetical protein
LPAGGFGVNGTSFGPPRLSGALALILSAISKRFVITEGVKRFVYNELKPFTDNKGKSTLPDVFRKLTVNDVSDPIAGQNYADREQDWWEETKRPRLLLNSSNMGTVVTEIVEKIIGQMKCQPSKQNSKKLVCRSPNQFLSKYFGL